MNAKGFWKGSSANRKLAAALLFCAAAAGAAMPAANAMVDQYGREISVTGTVTDSMCGARHLLASSDANCTRECVKLGASYALASGKKLYFLVGHDAELYSSAGQDAIITGRQVHGKIYVDSVTPMLTQAAEKKH